MPGGWLVVGEGVRPLATEPVSAELPFQLLGGFHDVALDAETRPGPGFLTAEAWDGALRRAGFASVEIRARRAAAARVLPRPTGGGVLRPARLTRAEAAGTGRAAGGERYRPAPRRGVRAHPGYRVRVHSSPSVPLQHPSEQLHCIPRARSRGPARRSRGAFRRT